MPEMNDIFVSSLGSVCFAKWNVCEQLGVKYLSSPFDNLENISQWQFTNIVELLAKGFKQICESDLEYREHQSRRIVDGKVATFRGYTYIGRQLMQPFRLPHFFDVLLGKEDAWNRWRHKCGAFQAALCDTSKKLLLLSLRLNSGVQLDTPERREYIARDAWALMIYLKGKYGRTPDNCRLLSIIVADDVDETIIEYDEKSFRQVVVSAGDEADTPYWDRKPREEYINIAKQYLTEFNQSTQEEQQP